MNILSKLSIEFTVYFSFRFFFFVNSQAENGFNLPVNASILVAFWNWFDGSSLFKSILIEQIWNLLSPQ